MTTRIFWTRLHVYSGHCYPFILDTTTERGSVAESCHCSGHRLSGRKRSVLASVKKEKDHRIILATHWVGIRTSGARLTVKSAFGGEIPGRDRQKLALPGP